MDALRRDRVPVAGRPEHAQRGELGDHDRQRRRGSEPDRPGVAREAEAGGVRFTACEPDLHTDDELQGPGRRSTEDTEPRDAAETAEAHSFGEIWVRSTAT